MDLFRFLMWQILVSSKFYYFWLLRKGLCCIKPSISCYIHKSCHSSQHAIIAWQVLVFHICQDFWFLIHCVSIAMLKDSSSISSPRALIMFRPWARDKPMLTKCLCVSWKQNQNGVNWVHVLHVIPANPAAFFPRTSDNPYLSHSPKNCQIQELFDNQWKGFCWQKLRVSNPTKDI